MKRAVTEVALEHTLAPALAPVMLAVIAAGNRHCLSCQLLGVFGPVVAIQVIILDTGPCTTNEAHGFTFDFCKEILSSPCLVKNMAFRINLPFFGVS